MKAWWILIGILLCPYAGQAFGPQDALAYRSKATLLTRDKFVINQRSARLARLGSTASLGSSMQEASKQSYSLNLHYERNPVTIAEQDRSASDTEREVTQLTRGDIATALQAHAALWQAQAALLAAQSRETLTALQLEEAERKRTLGALSETDRELARIDHADADLGVRRAKQAFITAQADAVRLALTGDATPTTMDFSLPAAKIESAPAYLSAWWDRATAKAREYKTARDLSPALVMEALHSGKTQVGASLSSRGPTGSVQMGYPTLYDPTYLLYAAGWTYTLRADIPLDPLGWSQAKSARTAVSLADVALKTQRDQLGVQLPRAKQSAEMAHEQLALARERLQLQQRKLELFRLKADTGAASRTEVINAEVARGDAETQLAGAWGDYVKAVAAYLDLTNGTWEEAR